MDILTLDACRFISKYAKPKGIIDGRHTWLVESTLAVISINQDDCIDYFFLESIATDLLDLSIHEFDYWLGELRSQTNN